MCLIIKINDKLPTNDIINEAWHGNNDGAGIAIKLNDKIKVIKGIMKLEQLHSIIKKYKNELIKNESYIHFRFTTSGVSDAYRTHPFLIDDIEIKSKNKGPLIYETTGKVLIHNGVMFDTNSKFSDTQIFARYLKYISKQFTWQNNDEIINFCDDIYKDNRIVLLDGKQDTVIRGEWHDFDDGNTYSNQYTLSIWPLNNWQDDYLKNEEYERCPCCDQASWKISSYHSVYECDECETLFSRNGDIFLNKYINAI